MATKRARRPVAPKHKVVGGYARLSVDRDGKKIGYEIQREAVQRWADAYGYTVIWYEDRDLTAADSRVMRPEYERMLKDLADGAICGIVVWRLDRLVRLTREFERCIGIVEDNGGFIADVQQQFTTQNDTGKIIMRLLVILADMEIASMRTRQLAHQRAKAERGKHHGGGARAFGFAGAVKDERGNILNKGKIGVEHVREEVELLREAARRIAWERETYSDVLNDWNKRTPPVVGTNGAPMSAGTLADLLTRPRIAGFRFTEEEDPDTGEMVTRYHKAEWEPVIDERTWRRLCDMKKIQPQGGVRGEYVLTGGLLRCGRCRTPLVHSRRKKWNSDEQERAYRCPSTVTSRARGACGGVNVLAEPVEKIVVSFLLTRLAKSPELFDAVESDEDEAAHAQLAAALGEVAECDDALGRLAHRRSLPPDDDDHLTEAEWSAMRGNYRRRRAAATETVDRVSKLVSTPKPIGKERDDLRRWFDSLPSVSQQRRFIDAYLEDASVAPAVKRGSHDFDPTRVRVVFAEAKYLGGNG